MGRGDLGEQLAVVSGDRRSDHRDTSADPDDVRFRVDPSALLIGEHRRVEVHADHERPLSRLFEIRRAGGARLSLLV